MGEMLAGGGFWPRQRPSAYWGQCSPISPPHLKAARYRTRDFSPAIFFSLPAWRQAFLASLDTAARVPGSDFGIYASSDAGVFSLAVAFAGGSMTALAMYEVCLGAVALVQWLCGDILLSLVKIYVLLILGRSRGEGAISHKAYRAFRAGCGLEPENAGGPGCRVSSDPGAGAALCGRRCPGRGQAPFGAGSRAGSGEQGLWRRWCLAPACSSKTA